MVSISQTVEIQLPLISIMLHFLLQILFRIKFDIEHIRKYGKTAWCKHQTCSFCSDIRRNTVNPQSSNKRSRRLLEDGVKRRRLV